MADTIGWQFSYWGDKYGAQFTHNGDDLDYTFLEPHEGKYPDGNGGDDGANPGSASTSDTTEGTSVVSRKHYWTLDLYSVWNQQTADYFATFHFNDYNNNDGARPTNLTIGVVDSITNREVAATKVSVPSDDATFTATVGENLPITTNNASTERVKYYMYLKDYTDIDGNKYVIQNTSASSGELALASISNADTSPMASYRYTIN